jgi:PadR family transcriptional regulator PadR
MALAVAIMQDPTSKYWGYKLSVDSGLRSGSLYPILGRLLEQGWLKDGWEDIDPVAEKRPPRRYYTLTELGARELGAVAAKARATQPLSRKELGLA